MAAEEASTEWQSHARLEVALELVFFWLSGEDLARCGATCYAWRCVVRRACAWYQLMCARASSVQTRALAALYEGACPWRELYVATTAPWRPVAQLTPERPTRLAAAALNRAGDTLVVAAEDCSFTIWVLKRRWTRVGAGSVGLGWSGVARAEWAPDAPLLLLVGPAPLSAQRGALAVLRPRNEGSWESWVVAARASGGGGCWAGEGFLSLELTRLSEPQHAPVFGTDVWLNAATQEAENEFAGTAARVLRVYNETRGVITQALCADVPLDARAAQEWGEAEATARAEDACAGDKDSTPLEEFGPDEGYYKVIYDRRREADEAWIRVVVLACGGVLGAWTLPRARPPPLSVPATALRQRVLARAERRQREAEAAAAGEVEVEAPELSLAELRARCHPPTARLRLPGPALGLTALDNGRAVWASVTGGALCASLPSLRVLRVVLAPPGVRSPHYLQPHTSQEYFASPCGGGSGAACVWGPAGGGGARLRAGAAPALAALLPRARAHTALLLTEDAVHVWQCTAPHAPRPDDNRDDNDSYISVTDNSDNDDSDSDNSSGENWQASDHG